MSANENNGGWLAWHGGRKCSRQRNVNGNAGQLMAAIMAWRIHRNRLCS
jgi:hypothetical protein